jgi:hypothetical protein
MGRGVPQPGFASGPAAVARRPTSVGRWSAAVGLGATAATPAGLVGWLACGGLGAGIPALGRFRSSRRLRGALGSSARLVAAPLQLLGFLGTAGVGSVLPGVGFLAIRDVGSATRPAVRSKG